MNQLSVLPFALDNLPVVPDPSTDRSDNGAMKMKSRMTLILVALTVIMSTLVYIVQDRKTPAEPPQMNAQLASAPIIEVMPAPAPAADSIAIAPTTAPSIVGPTTRELTADDKPLVRVKANGTIEYTARAGDTLSQLAIAFLGTDSKDHRDAVVAANETLQADPNRVLIGHTYSMPLPAAAADETATDQPAKEAAAQSNSLPAAQPAAETEAASKDAVTKAIVPAAETTAAPVPTNSIVGDANGPTLKYTARAGDTVNVLAAHLLGGDTKANRDLIIAANPSLQSDPDKIIVGQTYTIVAANGLANSVDGPHAAVFRSDFASEPDADEAAQLSVPRTLRYTAQPGDTVTKLATALLGSDTPANRDLIIKSNPSLKRDPDHLIAGNTYYIAAPTADAMP